MKVSDFSTKLGQTAKSLVKIALLSRKTTLRRRDTAGSLIIMGNGPSLRNDLENNPEALMQHDRMAVNFAANAPEFHTIRPTSYILVDPHFFSGKDDDNLRRLWLNLSQVSWSMTLIVPSGKNTVIPQAILENGNIIVEKINCVGAEGFEWLENMVFGHRLGMPRPRNVLIPAIMAGMWMGYKDIYLAGADHSWMKTISVDEQNRVISVQPHFYKDDEKEQKRVDTTYAGYRLHEIIHSFYVAFNSYHHIARWARRRRQNIYNATPGSFIDAFPRKSYRHSGN